MGENSPRQSVTITPPYTPSGRHLGGNGGKSHRARHLRDHISSCIVADMDDPNRRMELATLHDCLVPPAKEETRDARYTVRLKPSVLDKLETLTARHGTDISNFFNSCAERVTDEVG